MSLILKLSIDAICASLNALGGYHFLWMRRYIMPIMIGISFSIITHVWWVLFLTWPAIGTLSIGYSKDGNFGRALWLGVQCAIMGIGLLLTHHIEWYLYFIYIIFGCVLGGLYRNWNQIFGDIITGCYIGIIILLVR